MGNNNPKGQKTLINILLFNISPKIHMFVFEKVLKKSAPLISGLLIKLSRKIISEPHSFPLYSRPYYFFLLSQDLKSFHSSLSS